MPHRVRGAVDHLVLLCAAAVCSLVLVAPVLDAQATGKLEGTVTDQAGSPIASAQVLMVGTAFGALTNAQGYYFINNVPVGSYTLRVQFIGYAPTELRGVRVLGGQTVTADARMQPSAVVITGITIEEAQNPIVPRDQVTSKTIVSGDKIAKLPANNVREVITLEPGVVESDNVRGVSIRGGRPGEAGIYIEGVLVRNSQRGRTELDLGTNAVEEASVTTGALGAQFSDAQSGVVNFVTRAGGTAYQGAFSFETDDVGFDPWRNVGYNQFEGSFGGPVPGVSGLSFFLSGTLNGQASWETQYNRDVDRPAYIASGVDTVVKQPVSFGDPLSDTVSVAIPRFVQYSGYCSTTPSGTTDLQQGVSSNYGVECQGLRLPNTAHSAARGNAKLQYTYGDGSRLSLTGLLGMRQKRDTGTTELFNPDAQQGELIQSRVAVLNWTQNLARSSERAMALDVRLSYQTDAVIGGPLTRQSELATRDPTGGFMLSPLDFLVDFDTKHDVTIAGETHSGVGFMDDVQIDCLLAGTAACQDLVPFLDRDDFGAAQPYRWNPYAVDQSGRFPLFTSGMDDNDELDVYLVRERRLQAYADFDWQADRFNRIKLGGEFHRYDTRRFWADMRVAQFMSVYHEKPERMGLYAEDRLDLGDVVLVGGVRYDRFDTKALFPIIPGRISTASGSIPLGADTVTFATFDPLNPTANLVQAPAHSVWSPRVQVSFPVTERSNFRLSYAHQVQQPDYDWIFRGKNTDISVSNPNQTYGRDLDWTKTIIFEFGVRHAFSRDMVLDVAAYNKDKTADVAGRLVKLPDPGQGGTLRDFRVFNNSDFGNVRGVDIKLDRRFSNLFSGSVAYTFQVAKNTGSDPLSYFRTTARVISALTGETAPPPQAILPTDDNRAHNIAGSLALTFPNNWRDGTLLGRVLENVGAFATFRFASGLPFTRIENSGEGIEQGQSPLEFTNVEPINTSSMPWIKNIDLRVTKSVAFRGLDATLFVESTNLLNFKNVINLFIETGDVVNTQHRDRFVSEQVANLETQASAAGFLETDVSGANYIDFVNNSCADWGGRNTAGSAASGPVDCVLLTRAEARFGNGDGRYTADEYSDAFTAWYNLENAPSRFYGPGRRVRIGFEVSF